MAKRRTSKKTTRKKAPARKKSGARKVARKKKAVRKKAVRKKAVRKKAVRKKAARKKKAVRKKKATRRASPSPDPAAAIRALARKIVLATTGDPGQVSFAELYAEDATSTEATGDTVNGFSGLEEKLRRWDAMQESTTWKPLHVVTDENTICIEWDAKVKLRDGRTVDLRETAVHEVKNGKIVAERYYYNPMALAPPTA